MSYINFSISAKVAITRPPQATTAKVGTSVNLTCGVETANVLEVHFRWKRNFTPLIENSRIYTVKRGTRTSVLHIDNLKMTDIGMYTCSAVTTGSVGSRDTAEAYLTVVGEFYLLPEFFCKMLSVQAGLYLLRVAPRPKQRSRAALAAVCSTLF